MFRVDVQFGVGHPIPAPHRSSERYRPRRSSDAPATGPGRRPSLAPGLQRHGNYPSNPRRDRAIAMAAGFDPPDPSTLFSRLN
jgi:hypothetical protein